MLLGYVWLELINPEIGAALQLIPKIPNSAFALGLCYFFIPDEVRRIKVPFSMLKWSLPFLLIATINLPLVQYAKFDSTVAVISTWYWAVMLPPLMMRVVASETGRRHFAMISLVGVLIICIQYYYSLNSSIGDVQRGNMAIGVITVLPMTIGYIYLSSGIKRNILIISFLIMNMAIIPAGSRSSWLILPVELLLLMLFVLPKARIMFSAVTVGILVLTMSLLIDISDIYSSEALSHFETRLRKAREWEEDNTIWKRAGMLVKTKKILEESPLFGIGYSNRSFAMFEGGDIEFMGRLAKVRQIDAHNTFLNILGGTGILGFLAFLYFMFQVLVRMKDLDQDAWRRLDVGPFIVGSIGMFLRYAVNTHSFSHIVYTCSIIMALYVMQFNNKLDETVLADENKRSI